MRKFLIIPLAMTLAGCGAILHGSRQNVNVQSSPDGATVALGTQAGETYHTPATLNLDRKNSYVLTFTSPGYNPATLSLHNSIGTGTVIADVLLTGLVGVVVDGLTGSWYGLNPEAANVTLSKVGGSENDADAIHVSLGRTIDGAGVRVLTTAPNVAVAVKKQ